MLVTSRKRWVSWIQRVQIKYAAVSVAAIANLLDIYNVSIAVDVVLRRQVRGDYAKLAR